MRDKKDKLAKGSLHFTIHLSTINGNDWLIEMKSEANTHEVSVIHISKEESKKLRYDIFNKPLKIRGNITIE